MATLAFTLREPYAGTVEQVLRADADGTPLETQTVPAYTGGVVNAGGFDFNVRELLDDDATGPADTVVVDDRDRELVLALSEYPALKSTTPPQDAKPTRRYRYMRADDLRREAQIRGIAGAGNAAKDDLGKALEVHDDLVAQGNLAAAGEVRINGDAPVEDPDIVSPSEVPSERGTVAPAGVEEPSTTRRGRSGRRQEG